MMLVGGDDCLYYALLKLSGVNSVHACRRAPDIGKWNMSTDFQHRPVIVQWLRENLPEFWEQFAWDEEEPFWGDFEEPFNFHLFLVDKNLRIKAIIVPAVQVTTLAASPKRFNSLDKQS